MLPVPFAVDVDGPIRQASRQAIPLKSSQPLSADVSRTSIDRVRNPQCRCSHVVFWGRNEAYLWCTLGPCWTTPRRAPRSIVGELGATRAQPHSSTETESRQIVSMKSGSLSRATGSETRRDIPTVPPNGPRREDSSLRIAALIPIPSQKVTPSPLERGFPFPISLRLNLSLCKRGQGSLLASAWIIASRTSASEME